MRHIEIKRSLPLVWVILFGLIGATAARAVTCQNPNLVRMEADYILSCQYIKNGNSASGAFNDVYGAPTWVVPRENAMAILGLLRANECLNVPNYSTRANQAMTYLIKVQTSGGGWYDQYRYTTPVDRSQSPTQTAEVMIAMNKLGYQSGRYSSMTKAADFLIRLQNPSNKTGADDGLIGGGLDDQGHYHTWRWTSDNAYAYQALKAAARWAQLKSDNNRVTKYENAAARILSGINTYLKDPDSAVWHAAVDAQDVPVPGMPSMWINYAPQMLNLPAVGVGDPAVGQWIYEALVHQPEGGVVMDDGANIDVLSPGYSFQANLVWINLGQTAYRDAAWQWADVSGLEQRVADSNGITGGWIDWLETTAAQAATWERFIDTSFYFIAQDSGGYDFSPGP